MVKIFKRVSLQRAGCPNGDDDEDDDKKDAGDLSDDSREILKELESERDPVLEACDLEGFTTATVGSQSALYSRFKRCWDR